MTSSSLPEASASPRRSPFLVPSVIILIILGLLGSSVAVVWAVAVKHSDVSFVRTLAKMLPLPAAKLGSKRILYRDFLRSRDTLRTFLTSPAAKEQNLQAPLDQALEKNILEKMLTQAALEELAAQKNVTVTDADLRQSFSEVIRAASSTTPDVGVYLLQNFGWNEEDFRQEVLRPALLEERLMTVMSTEKQGDPAALATYLESRLKEKDVVRYLRFQ